MGLLDDMFKLVTSGDLEKKLGDAADSVEKVLTTAEKSLDKAESKVTGVSQDAGEHIRKFENGVSKAGKAVDRVTKNLPRTLSDPM